MRVLLIPEVYRPDDTTGCGTVRDAVAWVGEWLARDSTLHVYWLLPPRESAGYERADVLADLVDRTAEHTDDGRRLTEYSDYARTDLVYVLRSLGYVDTGAPGAPMFEPTAEFAR